MQPTLKVIIAFFSILTLSSSCGNSQSPPTEIDSTRWSSSEYRDANWRPSEGNYFFSEMWTWSYTNEMLSPEDPNRSGEMSFYLDPPSGTILLTKNDTKYTGDMIDWVIIHHDGTFSIGGSDEHGKPNIIKASINDVEDYSFRLESQQIEYKKYVKSTEHHKLFGENQYGWPTIEGSEHIMSYAMTNDQNQMFLAEVPFSMRYFYLVESVVRDIRLPINLTYGYILPENSLLLSDRYESGGKIVQMELKSMSPTEYFINTVSYSMDH